MMMIAAPLLFFLLQSMVHGTDPTYCRRHQTEIKKVNCKQCNCLTCQHGGCHTSATFLSCDHDSCASNDCWTNCRKCVFGICKKVCNCCHDHPPYPCKCKQCCDTKKIYKCVDSVTYHVISLAPSEGPATGGTSLILSGATYVWSKDTKCKFTIGKSSVTVLGTFLDAGRIQCITPDGPSVMGKSSINHTTS